MRNTATTIVVVDDDHDTVTFVCDFFTMLGMTVVRCHSDNRVASCVAEHHPALVILGFRLRDVTGVDMLHQLRADPTTHAIPVVFFTGSVDELRHEVPDLAAHNAHLVGKLDVEQLNAVVHQRVQQAA